MKWEMTRDLKVAMLKAAMQKGSMHWWTQRLE